MYSRYAERRGWKVEVISSSRAGRRRQGSHRPRSKATASTRKLRYESGVHRVQRVPATETQGRIHTSAVTVAVLPEAEEVDVKIEAKDLRIDTFCSSGPGGQSVNTTYSAVRITHIPTGTRRLLPGREDPDQEPRKAMRVLRARLYEVELQKQQPDRRRAQEPGRLRRPQREDPHLQLPAEPRDRPPHRPDAPPARAT